MNRTCKRKLATAPEERESKTPLLEKLVDYYPSEIEESGAVFEQLRDNLTWPEKRKFMGHTVHRRELFLHAPGTKEQLVYRFGGKNHKSGAIPESLSKLFEQLFARSRELTGNPNLNSVLLNYYDDKEQGSIAWHADDEECIARTEDNKVTSIVGWSFGGPAHISFRPAAKPTDGSKRKPQSIKVECGSAYVMRAGTQEKFEHSVRKGHLEGSRISATVREQF